MATRFKGSESFPGAIPTGYEASSPDSVEKIPSCGIEDVDRAFFSLFSEKLPIYYKVSKDSGEQRKVPVMFASGERFAVLTKSSPLRDRNGAMILPIISISRSGMEFESTKGIGSSDRIPETVISKKISSEDSQYQQLVNRMGLKNSGVKQGSGRDWYDETGRELAPRIGNNIYEVTVIPTPRSYTVKYEVTIWCQYVQQMNTILETILGSYRQPGGRDVRIDTTKGYWFVAHFDQTINQDNNMADFSEDERLIKATLSAEVPAYLVLPHYPGIPNAVKKYLSAPEVVFESSTAVRNELEYSTSQLESGDVNHHILRDIETEDGGINGGFIGDKNPSVTQKRAIDSLSGMTLPEAGKNKETVSLDYNPFTGEKKNIRVYSVNSKKSQGEEVYIISLDVRR